MPSTSGRARWACWWPHPTSTCRCRATTCAVSRSWQPRCPGSDRSRRMRWSVTVEAEGDRGMTREEIVELADAGAGHGGIASGIGTTSYGAQLVVEADTPDQ